MSRRIKFQHITNKEYERFFSKVTIVDNHWLWTGKHRPKGYGRHWWHGQWVQAHRFAYAAMYGDPGSKDVDHKCNVRDCVNPAHLEAVTSKEHYYRTQSRRKSAHA